MPRFSVPFGRRKSGADNFDNVAPTESSFRVLERSAVVVPGKSYDGGAPVAPQRPQPKRSGSDVTVDDNIFAGLKSNRYVQGAFGPPRASVPTLSSFVH